MDTRAHVNFVAARVQVNVEANLDKTTFCTIVLNFEWTFPKSTLTENVHNRLLLYYAYTKHIVMYNIMCVSIISTVILACFLKVLLQGQHPHCNQ